MTPTLVTTATAESAKAAEVFTIQHSSGSYPQLSQARCAAARVSARVGHGIQIFRNGKLFDYKRF